jgi:hypothetical protein
MALALLAVSALGCTGRRFGPSQGTGGIGPPSDPESVDYASGTRIRARVYVSPTGARLRYGWFDTAIGQNCSFLVATDGEVRCIPALYSDQGFLDPACTVPASASSSTDTNRAYAREWVFASCGYAAHELGQPVKAPVLYQGDVDGCWPLTQNEKGYARPWGPALDPSGFVAAAKARETTSGRLARQFLLAEDGTREAEYPYDQKLATGCGELTAFRNHQDLCLPLARVDFVNGYADPACSERLGLVMPCDRDDVDVPFGRVISSINCYPHIVDQIVSISATGCEPAYAKLADGGCVDAGELPNTVTCKQAGDVVDFAALAVFTPVHDATAGVTAEWLSDDGRRIMVHDFYDADAGRRCTPKRMADCKLHCVPAGSVAEGGALDPQCQQRLVYVSPACDLEPPAIAFVGEMSSACGSAITRVFATGQEVPPPSVLYQGGACSVVNASEGYRYFEAKEILPSECPELLDAIE